MTEEELREKLLKIQDDPRLSASQRAARMMQLGVPVSRRDHAMLLRREREIRS